MPTILLKNVTKIYKNKKQNREELPPRVVALSDIDLEVSQGEFLFLVGSSGSGKSTLVNLLAGDLRPDRGAVYYNDVNLLTLTRRQKLDVRRRMGKVPQESGLIRTVTVLRNLTMPVNGRPRDKIVDRYLVEKALGLVGTSGTEGRYPLELSISECRRIELAKAILHSPDVLFLDNMTARMDDDTIWDIMHLLDELNRGGTTVVMATGAKKFVNIMRKRVVTLSDGRIVGDVRRGRYGDIV